MSETQWSCAYTNHGTYTREKCQYTAVSLTDFFEVPRRQIHTYRLNISRTVILDSLDIDNCNFNFSKIFESLSANIFLYQCRLLFTSVISLRKSQNEYWMSALSGRLTF